MFEPKYKDVKPMGYYVYAHRRLSDMSIFYIGKGVYNRAWNKTSGRSQHWKNIANKHGVYVEILIDGLNEDDAFDFEIQMIRKTSGLINYARGGQGKSGVPSTNKQKECARMARSKPVVNSNGEIFESATEAAKHLNSIGIPARRVSITNACIRGRNAYGMAWAFASKSSEPPKLINKRERGVKNFGKSVRCSNGMVFNSMSMAVEYLKRNGKPKASVSAISLAANGKIKHAYGYEWDFCVDDES